MAEVLEFVIPVNLTGAAPVDVMQQDPPAGPSEVEILDVRQVTKEGEGGGKTTLRFNVALIEGPAKGLTTQVVIGTDWSKSFNVGHLANLLHGLHTADGKFFDPAKITGTQEMKPGTFKGKRAYIYTKVPPEGEIDEETGKKKFANKNFITRGQYETAKAASKIGPAAAGNGATAPAAHAPAPAASAPAPTPTPAPTGGGLGDLFNS